MNAAEKLQAPVSSHRGEGARRSLPPDTCKVRQYSKPMRSISGQGSVETRLDCRSPHLLTREENLNLYGVCMELVWNSYGTTPSQHHSNTVPRGCAGAGVRLRSSLSRVTNARGCGISLLIG